MPMEINQRFRYPCMAVCVPPFLLSRGQSLTNHDLKIARAVALQCFIHLSIEFNFFVKRAENVSDVVLFLTEVGVEFQPS